MGIKGPNLVRGLILSSCPHHVNEHTRDLCRHWTRQAQRGEWAALRWSLMYYTFTPNFWFQTFDPFVLKLYPGYGHGNCFENSDYPKEVGRFLQEVMARTK